MKYIIPALAAILLLLSCQAESGGYATEKSTAYEAYETGAAENAGQEEYAQEGERSKGNNRLPQTETKIIRTGELGIVVEDFGKARAELDGLLQQHKAYISNEEEHKSRHYINGNITIRIPAGHFDSMLGQLGGMAEQVKYKRINARDVTRQFVDMESRLRIKKTVRSKYETFLRDAKNVEEMLAVEREIRHLTEEIEAKEAELRYLSNQVSLSTLTLDISQQLAYEYEDPEYAEPTFAQRLGNGFRSGWNGLLTFFVGLSHIWPFIVLGIIISLGLKKLFFNNKKAVKQ